jgi:outer membrane protein OmpA-like peptidoglycan-associated protein
MARFSQEGFGNQDIYKIEFNPVKEITEVNLYGNIKPDLRRELNRKDLKMTIQALGDSTYNIDPNLTDSLTFSAKLKPGKYKLLVKAEGYADIDKTISISPDYSRKTYEVHAEMQPKAIEVKNFIEVDNIYFGYDSFSLDNESQEKLNKLAGIMKQYPDLTVEIIGHTDSKGSSEYNKKLSKNRAEAVHDYLKKKGVESDRMSTMAKGENYPLALNTLQNGKDCEEGRKYNRRVEIMPVSTNNNYIIKQTASIPQNLKKRGSVSYSILLLKQRTQLPKDYFNNFETLKKYTIKEYYNGDYLYLMGKYDEQTEAIEPFKKVLDMGFSKARILSSYQLTDILNIQSGENNTNNKK